METCLLGKLIAWNRDCKSFLHTLEEKDWKEDWAGRLLGFEPGYRRKAQLLKCHHLTKDHVMAAGFR